MLPTPLTRAAARPALLLPLAAALLLASGPALAELIQVGVQSESALNDAIAQSNGSVDDEDQIVFLIDLGNLNIPLTATPTPLDGGPDKKVELDGTEAFNFFIHPDPATVEDVPGDFVLLHVMSGEATLVNLDINADDFEELRGVYRVDAGASLGLLFDRDEDGDPDTVEVDTISATITGEGGVVKKGLNRLILTGDNDWSGGTVVQEGELRARYDRVPGDVTVEKDALLTLQQTDTATTAMMENLVTGEGVFSKIGEGALRIGEPGDADAASVGVQVTGGTRIEEGRLIGTVKKISGKVEIARNAVFELEQIDEAGDYAGEVSGAGSLRKSGTQDLTLSGNNSFGGGLFVEEGRVLGTSLSIPGRIVLEQSATTVVFQQDFDGTHNGAISGDGQLEKDGSGSLTLAGTSSHTGGTLVRAGRLRGDTRSLVGDISLFDASTVLEFAHADTQTFGGSISGPGRVVKSGAGLLVFPSVQGYTGSTSVNAGILQLNADLPGSSGVTVGPAAELRNGAALVRIGTDLSATGTVSTGAIGAVLEVGQDATLSGAAALRVPLDDQGGSPLLRVTGQAQIGGLRLGIEPQPGDYSSAVGFTVIDAGSMNADAAMNVSGTTSSFAFLTVENVAVDTTTSPGRSLLVFDLRSDVSDISRYATTPNQLSTADALEQLFASGSADADEVLESFGVLTVAEVPPVLDQIAGETLTSFTTGRITNAQVFYDAVSRRFAASEWETGRPARQRRAGGGPGAARLVDVAAAGDDGFARPGGWGAWLEPFAVFGDVDGRPAASDLSSGLYGVSGGLDYRLPSRSRIPHAERIRLGVGLGYTRHDVSNGLDLMSGAGNTVQTALYGGYRSRHLHVGLAGRFAWSSLESERRIVFQAVDRVARSSFEGREAGAFVELGGHFGDPKRLWLHPLLSFQYDHLSQDPIVEWGAGDLSLFAEGRSWDSMLLTVGGRISRLFTLQGEFGLEPELRGGYLRELGDSDRFVRARFWPVPGTTPFVTAGAPGNVDAGWVGLGWVMSAGEVPLVALDYDAYLGDTTQSHVISAGIYLRW